MQPLGDIGRHGEEFTYGWEVRSRATKSILVNRRTDKMPAFLNDPSGGAVESMVVSRGEIDDAEEKGISGLDAGPRGASAAFYGCADPHFGRDFNRFNHALSEVF